MNSTAVLDVVIAVAVLVWVLYRQTTARPVTVRQIWLLPAILLVLGYTSLSHLDHGHLSHTAVAYIAVDMVSSLAMGALRGCYVSVYARDGVMWRQGGRTTILLWVVSILIRVAIAVLAARAGVGNISDAGIEASFGLTLASQNAVVAYRGYRRGLPFALPTPRS